MKFNPNKRYIFSKELFLLDPARAMRYKETPAIRAWVDRCDGHEVEVIDTAGVIGNQGVLPQWCDERPYISLLRRLVIEVLIERGIEPC